MKIQRRKYGFSIIQVLSVGAAIVFLTILALKIYNPFVAVERDRDRARKQHLDIVQDVLGVYYTRFGRYPPNPLTSTGSCTPKAYKIKGLDNKIIEWGDAWKPFIEKLPKDPRGDYMYVYYASCDRQAYWLYASLEMAEEDPNTCNGGKACKSLLEHEIPVDACGGICNYAVTSPNVSP